MNFSAGALFAGFVFGVFGVYFVKRGKTNAHVPHIAVGVALIAFPYFVEATWLLWTIGGALLFFGFRSR